MIYIHKKPYGYKYVYVVELLLTFVTLSLCMHAYAIMLDLQSLSYGRQMICSLHQEQIMLY